MLSRIPFYHHTTKNMVIAVGGLFSNIFCVTKDINNVTQKIVVVPLAYANKEKFLVRIQQDPGLHEDRQVLLPRLSYEIVSMEYDSARQLNKTNKVKGIHDSTNVYSYSPVPYNLNFNLYSYTRTQEDNLQIMEQIVPYFTPDINLSIKIMRNPDVNQNCALILNSVNTNDQYDGGFEDRRYIITTYSLVLKMNYYGPIVGMTDSENHFENDPTPNVIKSIKINLNTNKYSAVIDPFDASAIDPYTIDESWTPRIPSTDFDSKQKL